MTMKIADPVEDGKANAVLFVDGSGNLGQDDADFAYFPTINTLKSKDQTNAATSDFTFSTGDVINGNGSSGSGALSIDTGDGSTNNNPSGSAGNSGNVTVSTGAGASRQMGPSLAARATCC